jgi:hypothetical protein
MLYKDSGRARVVVATATVASLTVVAAGLRRCRPNRQVGVGVRCRLLAKDRRGGLSTTIDNPCMPLAPGTRVTASLTTRGDSTWRPTTERELLTGTAVPASFLTEEMDASRSRRQVLILDCCHSGAFARGAKGTVGGSVGTAEAFRGTGSGRVVLTATDSTQYAWEGDEVRGLSQASTFNRHLVEGLRTGAADVNHDGWITLDELYEYVYDQVLQTTPCKRRANDLTGSRATWSSPATLATWRSRSLNCRRRCGRRWRIRDPGSGPTSWSSSRSWWPAPTPRSAGRPRHRPRGRAVARP